MLEQIDATYFNPSTGKPCTLLLADGNTVPTLLDNVTVNAKYRNPYAPEVERLPFSVCLTSLQPSNFVNGICTVVLENDQRLEGVYVSRVLPLGRDPSLAYYQILFG